MEQHSDRWSSTVIDCRFSPADLDQIHPTSALQFRKSSLLRNHVIRHVLAQKERWNQVFEGRLISAATKEWESSQLWGKACQELATAYEARTSQFLLEASQSQKWHDHHIREENGHFFLSINAWPTTNDPCYVVASVKLTEDSKKQAFVPVRTQGRLTYVLKSAYRPSELVQSDRQAFRTVFWRQRMKEFHSMNQPLPCPGIREIQS